MTAILKTVAIISSITGILAYLLSLANKTIANYGEKKMTINEEKEFTVDGGDTLLTALIDNEVYIPSACGGKGSCGYCKVVVHEGGGRFLPTEHGYVSADEEKEGVRLSCQLKVKEDIKIEIPEELFNVRQYDYDIEFMTDVTPKIKHIRVNIPEGEEISFKPGQYAQILAPKYKGNKEEVYRAYSIASAPADNKSLEFFIGYVENGVCTTYIHQHLKPEDKITIVGPYGDFYYQDNDRPMVMVAVGTGMAPIMSILLYMRDNNITERPVTFYFGARTRKDLYMIDEMMELKKDLPNFELITCLSRPTEECKWDGEQGRVTNLLEKFLDNGPECEAYLCGSPVMIDSVTPILKDKGIPEEHIFYDSFE
jgi:Na+-transporting NADH:ubiquinone oxidoreductase subunit F